MDKDLNVLCMHGHAYSAMAMSNGLRSKMLHQMDSPTMDIFSTIHSINCFFVRAMFINSKPIFTGLFPLNLHFYSPYIFFLAFKLFMEILSLLYCLGILHSLSLFRCGFFFHWLVPSTRVLTMFEPPAPKRIFGRMYIVSVAAIRSTLRSHWQNFCWHCCFAQPVITFT